MSKKIRTKKKRILIAEDDQTQLRRYLSMARSAEFDTVGVSSLQGALEALRRYPFDFSLIDVHLRSGRQDTYEGIEILKEIRECHPEIIPLAMSADPKIDTYNRVLAEGAAYLFRKPIVDPDELLIHLNFAEVGRRNGSIAKRQALAQSLPPSLAIRVPDGIALPDEIRERARRAAAKSTLPVVIYGETGTGKEEVAKLIHRYRIAIDGPVPFVAVNCANLMGDTAVSTLFGHKRGAFTGADETTVGLIGEANGGFLFLDEIQTLSMDCQQRLLRVFNDGTYNRLGDTQTLFSNFRILVATTKDLEEQVDQGSFLLDLSMRLTGYQIYMPPLRERKSELSLLIELALARAGATVSPEQLQNLTERCSLYYWQGNVRQLFQVLAILAAEAAAGDLEIAADDLPLFKTMLPPGASRQAISSSQTKSTDAIAYATLQKALETDQDLSFTLSQIEQSILDRALKRHGGSIEAVAEALGVGIVVLGEKVRKCFGHKSGES